MDNFSALIVHLLGMLIALAIVFALGVHSLVAAQAICEQSYSPDTCLEAIW